MGETETIARYIVNTRYEDIPEEAKKVTKRIILDGVGNMLGGSREPLSAVLIQYLKKLKDPKLCTLVGYDFKLSPMQAAFGNGIFCHCMDFEVMWNPPTHVTSPALPPALALGELGHLPGRDIVAAVLLGIELQGRLRLAYEPVRPIHPPGSAGMMGSAAVCARLLKLNVQQTRWAFGIAGSRASGLFANIGTMTKSTHSGNSARMGLESARMAQEGWTANEEIFEHPDGFRQTACPTEAFDLEMVVKNWGSPYRTVNPGPNFKMYPSQYPTHWPIEAALELAKKYDIDPKKIDRVVVIVGSDNESGFRPFPKTGLDGKFSVHYTVSAALLDRKVTIDTFRDSRRFAPDMEEMLRKVEVVLSPEIESQVFTKAWAEVTVTDKTGKRYSQRCDKPRGFYQRPATDEDVRNKFYGLAGRVLGKPEMDIVVEMVEGLEQLKDINKLTKILRTPPSGS